MKTPDQIRALFDAHASAAREDLAAVGCEWSAGYATGYLLALAVVLDEPEVALQARQAIARLSRGAIQ